MSIRGKVSSRRSVGLLIVIEAILGLAACGSGQSAQPQMGAHFDRPVYRTVEELAVASSDVVIGEVTGVAGRATQHGSDGQGIGDVHYVYYQFKVNSVHKGRLAANSDILVTRIDPDRVVAEDLTALEVGQSYALFLEQVPLAESAGRVDGLSRIASGDEYQYVLSGMDNGAFRANADRFVPLSPESFRSASGASNLPNGGLTKQALADAVNRTEADG